MTWQRFPRCQGYFSSVRCRARREPFFVLSAKGVRVPESAGPSPTAANRYHYRICQGARRIFGWVIYRPLDLPILHMRRSFYVSFPTPILHITLYRKYAITSSHNQICFHINSTFAKHQGYDDARCTAAERPATQAVQVRWQSCGRFFFFSFFTKKLPPNTHDGAEPRAGLELPKGFRLGFGLFQGSVTSGFGLLQGLGYFRVRVTSGFGLLHGSGYIRVRIGLGHRRARLVDFDLLRPASDTHYFTFLCILLQ